MSTECTQKSFPVHHHFRREVVARFDGGAITSDGGGLLLREVEKRTRIIEQFAECFTDHRDAALIEHTVEELVGQRLYALALGYEDLNDHDDLRRDPLLATLVGKGDPTGAHRLRGPGVGEALAGESTLYPLGLTKAGARPAGRPKNNRVARRAGGRPLVDLL